MNGLDIVTGLTVVAVFVYLIWTLLRPEDF